MPRGCAPHPDETAGAPPQTPHPVTIIHAWSGGPVAAPGRPSEGGPDGVMPEDSERAGHGAGIVAGGFTCITGLYSLSLSVFHSVFIFKYLYSPCELIRWYWYSTSRQPSKGARAGSGCVCILLAVIYHDHVHTTCLLAVITIYCDTSSLLDDFVLELVLSPFRSTTHC